MLSQVLTDSLESQTWLMWYFLLLSNDRFKVVEMILSLLVFQLPCLDHIRCQTSFRSAGSFSAAHQLASLQVVLNKCVYKVIPCYFIFYYLKRIYLTY